MRELKLVFSGESISDQLFERACRFLFALRPQVERALAWISRIDHAERREKFYNKMIEYFGTDNKNKQLLVAGLIRHFSNAEIELNTLDLPLFRGILNWQEAGIDDIHRLVSRKQDSEAKSYLLFLVATATLKRGLVQEAIHMAASISSPEWRNRVDALFAAAFLELLKRGEEEEAFTVACRISRPGLRRDAIVEGFIPRTRFFDLTTVFDYVLTLPLEEQSSYLNQLADRSMHNILESDGVENESLVLFERVVETMCEHNVDSGLAWVHRIEGSLIKYMQDIKDRLSLLCVQEVLKQQKNRYKAEAIAFHIKNQAVARSALNLIENYSELPH